ncbi:MAG: UTP--glucose-1-phosphate uridylyltransferase [Rhizobiaceae bacterium]
MTRQVRTAIIPVAGKGTRMLPATRAVPKELLPVLDRPMIDFAIDEAINAGVERLVIVNHPEKEAIRRHVFADPPVTDDGKLFDVVFASQPVQRGLGHAVLSARDFVLPGPIAVILPDDLIVGNRAVLTQMIAAYDQTRQGHLVATMSVPLHEVSRYGILKVTQNCSPLLLADNVVEKPSVDTAPSSSAIVGRYVLNAEIFDALEKIAPGANDEIQLTEAISATAGAVGLAGYLFEGVRFDCGSKEGLLAATLFRAQHDPAYQDILTGQNPIQTVPNAA